MKLGKHSQITIGTKDVQKSYALYEKLGFRKIGESDKPYPWIQITDDSTLILLSGDGMEYMGLTYFEKGMQDKVAQMEKEGVKFIQKTEQAGAFQAIFGSPDDFYISLVDYESPESVENTKKRTTLANYAETEWQNINTYPNPNCGIFGELCIPVKDLDTSIAFWEKYGFEVKKYGGPYPWAIGQDGMNIIGLHQTTEFTKPAITYFAKDMGEKIKALKTNGVESLKIFGGTGGNESNMVLTTPENQQFFLFSY